MLQSAFTVYRQRLAQDNNLVSAAMLLVRLAFGIGMTLHGLGKISAASSWMGADSQIPGFLQALAAYAEVGGGLGFVFGFLTPIASLAMIVVLLGALGLVHVPLNHPYVAMNGPSCELAVLYLVTAFQSLILGPGEFSLDYMLLRKNVAHS